MNSISPKTKEDQCILSLTSNIVSSYVGKNALAQEELSNLIRSVYQSLLDASKNQKPERTASKPAVPINKSIQDEYIICLEDGKKLKMLKRYLRTRFNLTPEQYRKRWGLPASYPMVAPNYSKRRSEFARKIGLGHGVGRQKTTKP